MKAVKILGSGCANCKATYKVVEEAAKAKGAEIALDEGRGSGADHGVRRHVDTRVRHRRSGRACRRGSGSENGRSMVRPMTSRTCRTREAPK